MTTITNASVPSELLDVLINNLHPYYLMFVRLQRKANIILHMISFWLSC